MSDATFWRMEAERQREPLCVCDAFGMCPQGCPECPVCSEEDSPMTLPSTPQDRTAFRILVTGSRTWDDKDFIWNVLDVLLGELGNVVIVHGAASGADSIAQGWVRHKLVTDPAAQVRAERHPANWERDGRAAGFKRNAAMVQLGADLCLAFVRDNSRGATNCADLAERAGIETRRFEYYAHSVEPVWPEGMYAP